ncbi:hypothetical protein ING2E5A_2830 [Petrimonas mucosa]|uniref:Uncharacterized protein n=1 Tax=Petrimonas mucosa TaxID=1642646 RepID=A0A1G4GAV2_9BACT|nr:hypothetical protein ING2E5A_2830 [Petrimonas mucosa]
MISCIDSLQDNTLYTSIKIYHSKYNFHINV